jgi:hypothetical protein
VTHILLNVDKDARIEPPIQVENIRSGGAAILIFVSFGDNVCFLTSLNRRSPNPAKSVEPPDRTIEENRLLRKSKSDLITEVTKQS